ncbi:MAG TPA: NAD(P)H-binding protein [Ktedonobacteraceae bacterium]
MQSLILVTGATGHVGRQVVSQLQGTGVAVRALARNPDSAGLQDGVDVVRGDLSVPDNLDACLNGVEAVFLLWPFMTADFAPAVLNAITKHARRIVYLSALSVRDDLEQQSDTITAFHAAIERLIEQSGLEWTILRSSGFATNTLGWAPQIRADGVVRWPYGAAARSLIHERDIAAMAVRALTSDGHGGAKYVLTGPQLLTQVEQVHTIGEVIGRPLRYEEISREAARQQMLTYWPPALVDGALDTWARFVTEPEMVSSTVEEVTGAPARTFRQWAVDHASDFR